EERWRGEADGERRNAAANEVSTCDGHRRSRYMSWYSDEPTISRVSPAALTVNWVSDPVHAPPAFRYSSSALNGSLSYVGAESRSRKRLSTFSAEPLAACASRPRLNLWLK